MRSGRASLRGEAGRVAERVRLVVATGRNEDFRDEPGEIDESRPTDGLLDRLSERLPVRLDPGRRPALAIAVVVVIVAVATGLWVMSARPRSMPVSAAAPTLAGASPLVPAGSGSPSASPVTSPAASAVAVEVVVDVAGKVRRPGLYRLPPGSRVDDALTAAGGALRGVDLTSLNLAALLVDGQQIAVGRPGAVTPAGPGGSGTAGGPAGGSSGGLVNLNTATLEQFEALPGIGPALAQRILDYRTEHGLFGSVDQLDAVSGIGTVTFARLKPLVTV